MNAQKTNALKAAADFVLDWLYPCKCMICERLTKHNERRYVCDYCTELFEYMERADTAEVWRDRFALFYYDETARYAVHKFKYQNKPQYADGFGALTREFFNTEIFNGADLLVPVPMFSKKQKLRGYNQAELLATQISRISGVEMLPDLLIRVRDTKMQSTLSRRERKENLRGAFIFNKKYNISSKRIFVIDDIYTTGATFGECSRVLTANGAAEVVSFSLAAAGHDSVIRE